MDVQQRVARLVGQAEQIVRRYLEQEVTLSDPTLVAVRERSLVARCIVTGWDGVASVAFKRNEGDDARGFTDWASLSFLSTLEGAAGVSPQFYGGDVQERLFVMEDLGGSRSLAAVLDNGDAATVVETLRALAVSMAWLVTATYGREAHFARIRAALPGAEDLGRRREAERWLDARGQVAQWADALGVRLPRSFDATCARIAAVYAEPGPYLAFSHGDPAPSNNHIAGERVRLLDFEYAAYRHALYDITAWYVLCPLPDEWVAAMDEVFRGSLGLGPMGHAFADEGLYREAWATMCAYRALAMLTWFPPDLLARDGQWTTGWTRRAALISTTLRLRQASARIVALEPLAELGGEMARELQARWPELGDGSLRWPGVAGAPR